jgi:hypothetical protein
MMDVESFDLLAYIPGAEAIVVDSGSKDLFTEPDNPIPFGEYRIAPWGDSNNLPAEVMDMVGKSEVVSSNLYFNTRLAYGQGIKPVLKIMNGKKVEYEPCEDIKVIDFFENNDVPGYFLEQCADMSTFFNCFPEIILNKGRNEIVSLRHKEAVFSRWGVTDKKTGMINNHFYAGDWSKPVNENNCTVTKVLSRYNPSADLKDRAKNAARWVVPISFPTPGKVYYQRPQWWSIFRSGSFDFSTMIWEFKKVLLKNGLRVRFIVYVSKKYWEKIFIEEKIDTTNPEAVKARKQLELEKFKTFLSSDKNHGTGLMVTKEMVQTSSTAIEEKYLTIEPIPINIKGGEYLEDSSEVSNMISYAMDVHQNLIATAPGKNGGTMSGTDKRELFMIKSGLMKPFRDRLMLPLYMIKKFNNWPSNLEFQVPDFEFTTLDKNKSGKEEILPDPNAKTEEK